MSDLTNNTEGSEYERRLQAHNARHKTIVRPGITKEEMVQAYEDWLQDENGPWANEALRVNGYSAPVVIAKELAKSVPPERRKEFQILDVGAGTGLAAKELRKLGFETMDALEPCRGFLQKAKEFGRYRNYVCEFVTDQRMPFDDDSYDAVTVCGAFAEGHVPCASLKELIRVVKPGGLVVIVARWKFIQEVPEYKNRLEPLMKSLENDGKWKCLLREIFPEYSIGSEGIKWKYIVL